MLLDEALFECYDLDGIKYKSTSKHFAQPKAQGNESISDDTIIYIFEVAPDRNTCPDAYRDELAAREAAQLAGYDKLYKVGYILKDGVYVPTGDEDVIELDVPIRESSMSDLDVEVRNAGGKDAWLSQAYETLTHVNEYIKFLRDDTRNHDTDNISISIRDDTITRQKDILNNLEAKINIVKNS